jgi:hypothetical protein
MFCVYGIAGNGEKKGEKRLLGPHKELFGRSHLRLHYIKLEAGHLPTILSA